MRTFHVGGTATRREEPSSLEVRHAGITKFINLHTVRDKEGKLTVMNRNGEIAVVDDGDRERERYQVNYGAQILVDDGGKVKMGQILAEWDPYTIPILTEVGGIVKFQDITEGMTMAEQVDVVTGLSRRVIVESR